MHAWEYMGVSIGEWRSECDEMTIEIGERLGVCVCWCVVFCESVRRGLCSAGGDVGHVSSGI